MSTSEDDPLMNIRGVSVLTSLSIGTLYHFVSQGRIPFIRISKRCIKFRRSDIEAWLLEKTILPQDAESSRRRNKGSEQK
jgi:excisionase family DNA binding protein